MPDIGLLLSTQNYAANALAIATGLTAIAILVFGIAVLARGRASVASILFFAITLTATGWLASFAFMYASQFADVALAWGRIGHLAASLIPAAVFHFAIEYVGRQRRFVGIVSLVWLVCALTGLVSSTTSLVVPAVRTYAWGYYPSGTAFGWGLFILYSAILGSGIALFWRSYRTSAGKAKERAGTLLLAFALGSISLLDFLPAIGVDMYPVGYVTMVAFTIVAATAVWRFELIDITPEYAASQILETMKGAVIVADMEGRIRVINRAACQLLGYSVTQLAGVHLRKILQPEDNMTTGQLLNSMGVLEQNMILRGADGTPIDVLASSSFVRNADGMPVGVVYVASDYTERKRAEEAIRASEFRYRMLFETNPLPMWAYDYETLRFLAVNDAAIRHYGYTRDEFLRMKITQIRPEEDVPAVMERLTKLEARSGPALFRHRKKDGSLIEAEVTSFELFSSDRRMRIVTAQDVTARRRAEAELRQSEERYRVLFERNLAGVYRSTVDGELLECNDACARIFGYENRVEIRREITPTTNFYFEPEDRARIIQMLREHGSVTNLESRMRRRDGSAVWVLENVTLLQGHGPDILEGTVIDITDRKHAQEQMEYQAYHDVLTELPNRLLFRDRITMALAHARRSGRNVAVMFLDLDQFKLVNDTLGHTAGDRLLQAIGARLVHCVRAEDTVARMGGDEFTILLSEIVDRRGASVVAQKVLEAIRHPVFVDEHELFVSTSIGIAIFPEDGTDAETLLKNADRAMYRAKEQGRNQYQFVTSESFSGLEGRLAIERSLHHALQREEFVVHYQPMVEIATGRVVGAEALVRWNHPVHGLIEPGEFIAVAEGCQLIVPLGEWVLRTACQQMKVWHEAGHALLRIAVNLSPRQFQQRDLAAMVERVLSDTGFPPQFLDLEITESTAMQNAELSLSILRRLKEMGIRISIDDFGTGYSSLSYLKRFPIDTVKIDQDFVRDLATDASDSAIISAVISMARALNLRVIAEGVETEEQLAFLQREHCEEMQGFLYSRALPAAEFEIRLREASGVAIA
ncbi:MAG TPA: EAL domain-containing protein [Thermoanaerobaculia bacterium]